MGITRKSELQAELDKIQADLEHGCFSSFCVIRPKPLRLNANDECQCDPGHIRGRLRELSESIECYLEWAEEERLDDD